MSATSDPQSTRADGGVRGRFPAVTLLLVLGALLANVIILSAVSQYGMIMLFAPVLALALALAALRLLDDPVDVLCWFLVIVVNLDFFRIQHTRLTADILTSSLLLYAVLVRLGLSGRLIVRGKVEKVYLVYIGITFISVVLSVDVPASIKNWGRDVEYLLLFVFVSTLSITDHDRLRIAKAAALSSVIPCLLGLAGMIFGIEAFYGQQTPVAGGPAVTRIIGTLSHPVTFSEYLAFISTITLSLVVLVKRWRAVLVPVFLLELTVLYLTFGRTGWMEFAIAVLALFWFMGRRKIVFIVLPVMAAGILAAIPTLLARMQNAFAMSDNSMLWRFGLWIYALRKFPQRPIFGSGPDTFINYVHYGVGFASHHTWIGLLIEVGLVGTFMYLLLMITVGRALKRRRQEPGAMQDPLLMGVSAAFVGLLFASFAGDPFDLPSAMVYFWILLALALKPRSLGPSAA